METTYTQFVEALRGIDKSKNLDRCLDEYAVGRDYGRRVRISEGLGVGINLGSKPFLANDISLIEQLFARLNIRGPSNQVGPSAKMIFDELYRRKRQASWVWAVKHKIRHCCP
jgi:hypothetical protein